MSLVYTTSKNICVNDHSTEGTHQTSQKEGIDVSSQQTEQRQCLGFGEFIKTLPMMENGIPVTNLLPDKWLNTH